MLDADMKCRLETVGELSPETTKKWIRALVINMLSGMSINRTP